MSVQFSMSSNFQLRGLRPLPSPAYGGPALAWAVCWPHSSTPVKTEILKAIALSDAAERIQQNGSDDHSNSPRISKQITLTQQPTPNGAEREAASGGEKQIQGFERDRLARTHPATGAFKAADRGRYFMPLSFGHPQKERRQWAKDKPELFDGDVQ
jgi:hypothetical protein